MGESQGEGPIANETGIERLRLEAERFRATLAGSPILVYETDAELRYTWVHNPHPAFDPAQVLGKRDEELAPEDHLRELIALKRRVVSTGVGERREVSVRVIDEQRVYDMFVEPIRATADRVTGLRVVANDITQRRELERRLLTSELMATIGSLAVGVAHEVNNPLAFVLGNLDILQHDLEELAAALPPADVSVRKLRRALACIADAQVGATRVRDIVADLRTLARPEQDATQPIALARVLDTSLKLASHELKHKARVVRNEQPGLHVLGNETRLGQLFVNVLVNAAQAIPPGAFDRHRVEIDAHRRGTQVVIQISDTGCGMARELLQRIFDPFVTTKHESGSGLGLSICQRIVESHAGTIDIDSTLGAGTTVRLTLPAADAASTEHPTSVKPTDETPGEAPLPRAALRVLVVDDEAAICRTLANLLSPPHEVVTETCALEALLRLERGERFDAIFCDVTMPNVTGRDFFERVRHVSPKHLSRVIFMTGGATAPRARELLASIPNPCLDKPFVPNALARALEAVTRSR